MLDLSWPRQTLSTHSKHIFKRAFEHSFTHIQEMADQLLFGTAERIINTLILLVAKEIGLLWDVKDKLIRLMNAVSTEKPIYHSKQHLEYMRLNRCMQIIHIIKKLNNHNQSFIKICKTINQKGTNILVTKTKPFRKLSKM
jgi:hypothetical protein